MRSRYALVVLTFLVLPFGVRAEDAPHVPIDKKCSVEPDQVWTPQEKFVWGRVCIGATANFNAGSEYGGDLDPRKPDGWPQNRVLRSAFLETILLKDPYRGALTRTGVRIVGARFTEDLDLAGAQLGHPLVLYRSLFERGANLPRVRSAHLIDLGGSKVGGTLNMDGIQVDQSLFLRDRAEFTNVILAGARVGGQLDLSSSKVTGTLNMGSLRVDQSLFMRNGAAFTEVVLRGAHVGGQISLSGSKVTGTLDMDGLRVERSLSMGDKAEFADVVLRSAHVGGNLSLIGSKVTGTLDMDGLRVRSLFMRDQAAFAEVVLRNAHVGEQLSLTGSKVTGTLNMNGLRVDRSLLMGNKAEFTDVVLARAHIGGDLSLSGSNVTGALNMDGLRVDSSLFLSRRAEFHGPIDLVFGRIGGTLELAGGIFHQDVDLTGTAITAELRLGSAKHPPAQWRGKPTLTLRNARAEAIQDLSDAWPAQAIELTGFTYRSLGGFHAAQRDPMGGRSVEWFQAWLGKQKEYAAAPYEQLASVLRSQGRPRDADEILYTNRERERSQASFFRYLWLTAMKYVIGYGYHIDRALIWVAVLILAGIAVLRLSGEGKRNAIPYGIVYSFDMLLPVIQLRKSHYDIDLQGWPRYYFYLHKVMGYVLASFLIVGISGLTK